MGMIPTYNEGDSGDPITISFKDSDGVASTPSTIHYRIDCLTTGTEVRDDASIGVDTSVTVDLASTDTAIQDSDNSIELKRVRVIINKTLETQKTEDYLFQVRNLSET